MFTLNFNPMKSIENPEFGEIGNYCMKEYDESFNRYFKTFLEEDLGEFSRNFGEIVFGEIKSSYLRDYRKSINNYYKE